MSYVVMIQVAAPHGEVWPVPATDFRAWSDGLVDFVKNNLQNLRAVPVYGPHGKNPISGAPTPVAYVNLWTQDDAHPRSWVSVWCQMRRWITDLEDEGYDIAEVSITPSRHHVVYG